MEKQIEEIAKLMQFKLDKNKNKECSIMNIDGKGRKWDQCSVQWLLLRLKQETEELEEAIRGNKSPGEIALECADVCNFAMMIADNSKGL